MIQKQKKTKFFKIRRYVRWENKYPPDNWTIIGIALRWVDPENFHYKLCFFGFELFIHFKRVFK